MLKTVIYNQTGQPVGALELNPEIFAIPIKPALVQQAVVSFLANQRKPLAHTKGRGEVAGGGRKPWQQKGTGRARHGSIRSPLWRGGGVTFGPTKNRNFSLKINKKVKRQAILMALSEKAAEQKIILLDRLELTQPKTKNFFNILQNLNLRPRKSILTKIATSQKASQTDGPKKKIKAPSILLVLPKKDEIIQRSARNIFRLDILPANSLNIFALIKSNYLLLPVAAIAEIKKTFVK
jgi:large subunit ribosomal protein L4